MGEGVTGVGGGGRNIEETGERGGGERERERERASEEGAREREREIETETERQRQRDRDRGNQVLLYSFFKARENKRYSRMIKGIEHNYYL